MKRNLVIDWILIPTFFLTLFTGIGLHIAKENLDNHATWFNWRNFHIITSLLFLSIAILHVQIHRGWFKALFKNGIGKKSRITTIVSIIFVGLTCTGVFLLATENIHSKTGLWHYRIGLVSGLLYTIHILKHLSILKRSLVKKG